MSKMRRYIIQPFNFGSTDGYGWEDDTGFPEDNEVALAAPHHDYCSLYSRDYSVRVWEPGRHAISQPGVLNAGTGGDQFRAPEMPMKCTIHGIKGAAYFRFDGSKQGVGTWWYVAPGEDGGFFQYPVQPDWRDTYHALAGMPMRRYLNFDAHDSLQGAGQDKNPAFRMPLFCTLYRGTYKQLDAASGWEIDTGPNDDPDTLIAMNITNPSVLESERIHWWDMDMVQLPYTQGDAAVSSDDGGLTITDHSRGPGTLHKYALNLSENHRLRPDQVLWLHWATGMIRIPVALPDQAGGTGAPVLTCAFYRDHKFSVSVQASMLATATVATS